MQLSFYKQAFHHIPEDLQHFTLYEHHYFETWSWTREISNFWGSAKKASARPGSMDTKLKGIPLFAHIVHEYFVHPDFTHSLNDIAVDAARLRHCVDILNNGEVEQVVIPMRRVASETLSTPTINPIPTPDRNRSRHVRRWSKGNPASVEVNAPGSLIPRPPTAPKPPSSSGLVISNEIIPQFREEKPLPPYPKGKSIAKFHLHGLCSLPAGKLAKTSVEVLAMDAVESNEGE